MCVCAPATPNIQRAEKRGREERVYLAPTQMAGKVFRLGTLLRSAGRSSPINTTIISQARLIFFEKLLLDIINVRSGETKSLCLTSQSMNTQNDLIHILGFIEIHSPNQ
jgi:hypothetical protein